VYFTEFPDRELSLEYVMKVRDVVERFRYNIVICSGGYTRRETPTLSEADSFLNVWNETQTKPSCPIVLDRVALDSAENVIFGLMALRLKEPAARVRRIGFFSQWHFKKPRMTSLATDLGIDKSFFFHGHADADHANAGDAAKAGEARQLDAMRRDSDFLLLGKDWAKKRAERYQHPTIPFASRDAELRMAFPSVFETLRRIERTTVEELAMESLDMEARLALEAVRRRKIEALQTSFAHEVLTARTAVPTV
jgi:hypothetical protein